MPSPEGCFVQVWDAPDFGGITEYLNGPAVFTTLRDLPRGQRWENRIRSLETGARARVTIYNGETFSGRSLVVQPDTQQKRLIVDFDGRIAALRIDCR
jgi:hypothetical protein